VKKLVSAAMLLAGMLSAPAMAVDITGNDFDGTYYEVGYANALSVADTYLFDYNIYYVYSDSDLVGDATNKLVPGVSRKFDIFSN